MKKLLQEFKAFALGGSLVDLAIGIAIGAAFAGVVQSLVDDLITPIPAAILGKNSFRDLHFTINNADFMYGDFLVTFVGFLLLALVILFIVKGIKNLTGVEAAGAQGNRECDHCRSFIPVDASVCMYCTRDVVPIVAE
jgi:large conductance mechanosensitive channel